MKVVVKMEAPKYVRGSYTFDSLGKLYDFLALIKGLGESNIGPFIFTLAKDGVLNLSKYGFSINAKLDCADYVLANKLAKEIGLVNGFGRFKPAKAKILTFVKAFDSAML